MLVDSISHPAQAHAVDVIRDLRRFETMEPEWTSLFRTTGCDNPFLSFEWMHEWWLHFGTGRLFVIAVRNSDGEIMGVAPFYLDEERRLCLLGNRWAGSDHLDVLASLGRVNEVAGAVARTVWAHKHEWRFVELSECDENAPVLGAFRAALRARGVRECIFGRNVCPFANLPRSFDLYLERLNGHWRRTFRHALKSLSRAGEVHLAVLEDKASIIARYADLIRLHRQRFETLSRNSAVLGDRVQSFHRSAISRLADRGWVRLYLLEWNGDVLAAGYGLYAHSRFLFLQAGFDPAYAKFSAGAVLTGLVIEDCIRRGAKELDFLRGDERYKFHWTDDARRSVTIRLFNRGPYGALLFARAWLSSRWSAARRNIRLEIESRPTLRNVARRLRLLPK